MENHVTVLPPFIVRTAGVIDRRPNHSSPGTRDGDFMLVAILAGRGSYSFDDGEIALRRGMVGLIPPERPGWMMAHRDDPYLLCYCRFGGEYAHAMARQVLQQQGARFFAWPRAAAIARCVRQMGRIRQPAMTDTLGRPEVLLAECLVALSSAPVNGTDPRPLTEAELRHWFDTHVDQPTNLDRIAEAFAVSRSTLCRRVRALTGSTPQVLHEKAKMKWAGFLLRNTGLSIKQIARRLGYADQLYFARVFRRYHRRTASSYRHARLRG